MYVAITSVNVRYKDGKVDNIQVHFTGYDEGRTVHINGYIPLTAEEYAGNEALDKLEKIVRQTVSEKVMENAE